MRFDFDSPDGLRQYAFVENEGLYVKHVRKPGDVSRLKKEIGPTARKVLQLLLANYPRTQEPEFIREALNRPETVSGKAFAREYVRQIRKALPKKDRKLIENSRNEGYRFAGEVRKDPKATHPLSRWQNDDRPNGVSRVPPTLASTSPSELFLLSLGLNPEQIKWLQDFYMYNGELQCIVSSGPFTWHYLDGDKTNTTEENLVPLCPKLSDHLGEVAIAGEESATRGSLEGHLLAPENLMEKAKEHSRAWNYAAAYGCARLGVFVGVSLHIPLDTRLKCTAEALHQLRHRPRYDPGHKLLLDVLRRDIIKYLEKLKGCDPKSLYLIVNELADLYGEYRANKWANWLYAFGKKLSGKNLVDPSSLRRDGMATYSITTDSASVSSAYAMLKDAQSAGRNFNIEVGNANSKSWIALSRAARGDGKYSLAFDAIEPRAKELVEYLDIGSGVDKIPLTTGWNVAEALLNYVIAAILVGKSLPPEILEKSINIFQIYGAVRFELHEGFGESIEKALRERLLSTGGELKALRERLLSASGELTYRKELLSEVDEAATIIIKEIHDIWSGRSHRSIILL